MTSRQLYEGVLIELNKENAPNIVLEDFNYFANKAINNYINKRYNIYDINQQTTDDLRVLKATALLKPTKVTDYNDLSLASNATYQIILPPDYLHILNCICIYSVEQQYKCYNKGDSWRAPAKRLTADMYSQVLDNFWNKPTYKKPYYYIHNVNTIDNTIVEELSSAKTSGNTSKYTKTTLPTDTITKGKVNSLDDSENWQVTNNNDGNGFAIAQDSTAPKTIKIGAADASAVERAAGVRYGNEVRCEIRYGTDDSVFKLKSVYVDYIKAPQTIRLTQEQLDKTVDTSQALEYPDYVCQEIINELVHLVMETISDPRLQTHPVVNQSIANPAQAQAPEAAGQTAQ